ncbi:hypothetical protein ACJX0J_011166, partial [Zea mays]
TITINRGRTCLLAGNFFFSRHVKPLTNRSGKFILNRSLYINVARRNGQAVAMRWMFLQCEIGPAEKEWATD